MINEVLIGFGWTIQFLVVLGILIYSVMNSEKLKFLNERVNSIYEIITSYPEEISDESPGMPTQGTWTSIDGKYSASSMEELIKKIISNNPATSDDINQLKKFFDNSVQDDTSEDNEDTWDKDK